MKQPEDHMDELFRKAGENYPLKTDGADWDKVMARLQNGPESAAPAPLVAGERRGRKAAWLLLLLLLIPAGWLLIRYSGKSASSAGTPSAYSRAGGQANGAAGQANANGATVGQADANGAAVGQANANDATVGQANANGATVGQATNDSALASGAAGQSATDKGATSQGATVRGAATGVTNPGATTGQATGATNPAATAAASASTTNAGTTANARTTANAGIATHAPISGLYTPPRIVKTGTSKGRSLTTPTAEATTASTPTVASANGKDISKDNGGSVASGQAQPVAVPTVDSNPAAGNSVVSPAADSAKTTAVVKPAPGSAKTATAVKPSPDSSKTTAAVKPAPDSAKTAAAVKPAPDSAKTAATTKPTKRKTPPARREHGFYAGIVAGPDVSTVKWQQIENPGYSAGITLGYRFSRSLSVQVSGLWDHKNYYTSGEYFDRSKVSIPTNINLLSLTGNCSMIELPLVLKWDFAHFHDGSSFFVSGGMSSYLMKKEFYNYKSENGSGYYGNGSKTYYNSGNDFFAMAQLSAGYTFKWAHIGDVSIEPYWKLPVKGMGIGSLPLTSTGLYISLTHSFR